jgi:hypothetical protein
LPIGNARCSQEHFLTADRKKVKWKPILNPRSTTEFSFSACHKTAPGAGMSVDHGFGSSCNLPDTLHVHRNRADFISAERRAVIAASMTARSKALQVAG